MTVIDLARRPAGWLMRWRAGDVAGEATTTSLLLLTPTALLLGGGLIMILSSSWVSAYRSYGSSFLFFQRQLLWTIAGVAALLVFSRIDYRRFRLLGYGLLAVSLVMLVLVLHPSLGVRAGGSQRWLVFGPIRVQPSELVKLAIVLVGADLCVRKGRRLRTMKDLFVPYGALALVVAALVMLQPDLGTTLIIAGIVFITLFIAGAPVRLLALMGVAGAGAAMVLALTEGYRRARLFSFLDPFADPLNAGYQAVQSQIALGSGGLFGAGLGAGRQKWAYVPNAHTDFIFAIIGEEVGLLGTFAVLGLFGLFAYAGVRAARRAPDAFGRIVAGAVTAWVIGQAVVNMGAVTGLLPITGVPLPMVSFGGSSLLITLAAIGIVVNIARHEEWPPPKRDEPLPRRRVRAS